MPSTSAIAGARGTDPHAGLATRYRQVRARSCALAAPLSAEDAMVQSMPDASPAKWHLAHTTWFLERFVLGARPGYRPVEPAWDCLFNSYYQGAGPAHPRPQRGLLTRPPLERVLDYRELVDARIEAALVRGDLGADARRHIELGLQHEQQHQELLLTDIKHAFWANPLHPAYHDGAGRPPAAAAGADDTGWLRFAEALVEVGQAPWPAAPEFAYDNESPRHRVLLGAYALATRPVSNGGFRAFIEDGGYRDPRLWLSDGWDRVREAGWNRPLYWDAALEHEFTLAGMRPLDPRAPVCHLSYYEADAFARWAGARLPTEFEWERAAREAPVAGNFADDGVLHPVSDVTAAPVHQLFGDVWEWTASAYAPYPGFRPLPGTLGEYNGKFMCGQQVLRGGSCASPRGHLRASYRNFFHAPDRWQFSGLRLARDGG